MTMGRMHVIWRHTLAQIKPKSEIGSEKAALELLLKLVALRAKTAPEAV